MKQLTWSCPVCTDCKIIRGSEAYLEMAVASHILTAHEERSALLAVDKARLSCPETTCSIGRRSHFNKTIGTTELTLTDFDKSWLAGMRISID